MAMVTFGWEDAGGSSKEISVSLEFSCPRAWKDPREITRSPPPAECSRNK
jgi:hypothetical protein